jgi:hypothetical protein
LGNKFDIKKFHEKYWNQGDALSFLEQKLMSGLRGEIKTIILSFSTREAFFIDIRNTVKNIKKPNFRLGFFV